MDKIIGPHLSNSKGYMNIINEMKKINANTFQFFTRNPRGTKAKELNIEDINNFKKEWKELGGLDFVAHAPYTYNLCSSKKDLRELALRLMDEDIKRLNILECPYYNFHPGSHTGQGSVIAINQISEAINILFDKNIDSKTTLLIETMAGKGTEVGKTFEEISLIIDKIDNKNQIGVLIDTCHIFDGGYDIKDNLDKVINDFDKIINLKYLKAIHLNDSLNELNSHKDRHAKLGEGNIGIQAIANIINHPILKNLPLFLETPNDLLGYKKEIQLIRDLSK